MNAVILLGPPGAGKGTVAEVLGDVGYTHVSTGELLRKQIRLGTPTGEQAKKLIDYGNYAPDEVVIDMIHELLEGAGAGEKFLFDGYPRTLVQAKKFDKLIRSIDGQLSNVILLECPDEVLIERLVGRRTCKECGTVYHIVYNPASVDGVCDLDGGELEFRPDDRGETVRKRLKVHVDRTEPLIGYYRDKGLIETVDARLDIGAVREAVLSKVG